MPLSKALLLGLLTVLVTSQMPGLVGYDPDTAAENSEEMREEYIVIDEGEQETSNEQSGTDSEQSSQYIDEIAVRNAEASNPYSESTPLRSAASPSAMPATGMQIIIEVYATNPGLSTYSELYPGDRTSPTSEDLEPPPPPPPPTISVSSPADFAKWAAIDEDDLDDGDVYVILSSTAPLPSSDTDDASIGFVRSFLQV